LLARKRPIRIGGDGGRAKVVRNQPPFVALRAGFSPVAPVPAPSRIATRWLPALRRLRVNSVVLPRGNGSLWLAQPSGDKRASLLAGAKCPGQAPSPQLTDIFGERRGNEACCA
jgi:hypothetical protein